MPPKLIHQPSYSSTKFPLILCFAEVSCEFHQKPSGHPVCMGSLTPVHMGYLETLWTPRAHGVLDPRAHVVDGKSLDTPCARG